jgi:dihydroflavonol-4-reductase
VEGRESRVLVTGANGHLGFNLVSRLLADGHAVRGSIRSLAEAAKAARLTELGDIELCEVELQRPGQLRAAMEGMDLVFHTAAVFSYVDASRNAEMLGESVTGAALAVRAAADAGVRKLVLTSSIVTVPMTVRGAEPVDESQWSSGSTVPYMRSKIDAERAAWRAAQECGVNMVSILPGAIIGPGFARNTPTLDSIEAIMRGALRFGAPAMNMPLVDVRDVVHAHCLAADRDCDGRFLVCQDEQPSLREIADMMHAIDRRIPRAPFTLPDFMTGALPLIDRLNRLVLGTPVSVSRELAATVRGRTWNVTNHRIRQVLDWQPMVSLEASLRDTMRALRSA